VALARSPRGANPGGVTGTWLWLTLLLAQTPQGTPVVNISAPELARAPHLTIAGAPVWRIGGEPDGPYGFARIVGGTFMREAQVAVLEGNPPGVRLYDNAGKHVLSFGRAGSGPGEFGQVQRLVPHVGDSLVVSQIFRVSVFDGRGKHARTLSTASAGAGRAMVYRMFPDGSLLAKSSPMLTPREMAHGVQRTEGITRDTTRLVILAARGDAVAKDFGNRPSGGSAVARLEGVWVMAVPAFAADLLLEGGDSLVYVVPGGASRVEVLSAGTTRLLRTVAFDLTPRAVTARDKDEFVRGRRAGSQKNGGDRALRMTDAYLKIMPYPERMPYFDALRWSFDGVVRLRRYATPSDSSAQWISITPHGRLLSVIDVPTKLRVLDFNGDRVLVVERDADDVEYLAVYVLVPRRR
jgi:hypothetical protein